ncbi:hydroxyisourate hydrolase [Cobetia crustatorum]|uniref:5-hydroxyisourate hydrolase n=1 Tax=Cobetia crustatorum TaxID=553385 RepID=A0A558HLU5_9GAMM|nr:hydroxyisourate hydrolase [Cobetia crustatorum]TVU70031.1 hydroxyisourate hydrolase [Cobetia crustatorum]
MPKLTTHVLNQAEGIAGSGIHIVLEQLAADGSCHEIARSVTNADGRLDAPLLDDDQPGDYRLSFMVGEYFATRPCGKGMLMRIPVECSLEAEGHYHIPLLVTPWAYSVYRGS